MADDNSVDLAAFTAGLDVNLIDGKLIPGSGGTTFTTLNPATEEVLGNAADGTAEDMDAAIGAARTGAGVLVDGVAYDGRAGWDPYRDWDDASG